MTATNSNYMAALDEAPSIEQGDFEPIGDQSTEVDAENEIVAFVARPEANREIEAKPMRSMDTTSGGTGRSAFAEAAGLS